MGMRKHDALPKLDGEEGLLRERDREPVDGKTPADYPLLARCQSCNREIRIESYLGSGWKHTAAPRPPKTDPDEIAVLERSRDLYGEVARRLEERVSRQVVVELPTRTPQASGHAPPHGLPA
jgi:hypothetical protein